MSGPVIMLWRMIKLIGARKEPWIFAHIKSRWVAAGWNQRFSLIFPR